MRRNGNITVEACFIMPILFCILFGIVSVTFFLYDQAKMYSESLRVIVEGEGYRPEKNYIVLQITEESTEVSKSKYTASFQGEMRVRILSGLDGNLGRKLFSARAEMERPVIEPVDFIRKARIAEKLLN